MAGKGNESFESRRRAKDGREMDVWITATALRDEEGTPYAVATTERDLTERKAAAKARTDASGAVPAVHKFEIYQDTTLFPSVQKECPPAPFLKALYLFQNPADTFPGLRPGRTGPG